MAPPAATRREREPLYLDEDLDDFDPDRADLVDSDAEWGEPPVRATRPGLNLRFPSGSSAALSRITGMFRRPARADRALPGPDDEPLDDEAWFEDEFADELDLYEPPRSAAPTSRTAPEPRRARTTPDYPERDEQPRASNTPPQQRRPAPSRSTPEPRRRPVEPEPTTDLDLDPFAEDFGGTPVYRDQTARRRDAVDPTSANAWIDEFPEETVRPEEWDDLFDEAPPPVRPARGRAQPQPQPRPRRAVGGRPAVALPAFALPALSSSPLLADRIAVLALGLNLLSVVLMALVLALRIGGLPEIITVHLDAAGIPDRWGPARLLWRIPLLCLGITLVNLTIAWFIAPFERFGSRFLLAAAFVVQILAWIALFDFI